MTVGLVWSSRQKRGPNRTEVGSVAESAFLSHAVGRTLALRLGSEMHSVAS